MDKELDLEYRLQTEYLTVEEIMEIVEKLVNKGKVEVLDYICKDQGWEESGEFYFKKLKLKK